MTVLSQTPYTRAVGNGVTTVFPFTFKLLSESDLVVSVDGVVIPDTAYSVSGLGENAGGDVTFLDAPAISADVFFERVITFERLVDYQYAGDLKAEVLNPDVDRLWMAMQQIQSLFDRSIHFPAIESGIDSELPALVDRENNLLGFDENGDLVAVAPAAQSATALQALLAQSSGASLIGFIQAFTGAIARTQQAKSREWSSILDAGATGDGVADDSAELTIGVAGAPYGSLVLPVGTYLVGDNQVSTPNLIGQGSATVLKAKTAATEVLRLGWISSPSQWTPRTVSNLMIDGNAKASIGISLKNTSDTEISGRWVLEKFTIKACSKGFNKPNGNIGNALRDGVITGCDFGYYAVGQTSPLMHAGCDVIDHVQIDSCNLAAIYIDSPQTGTGGTVITGESIIEYCAGFGVFVKNYGEAFNPFLMDGVWFEGNASAGTVTINGVVYVPKDVYLENCSAAVMQNGNVRRLQLVNSRLTIDNCAHDDTSTYAIDSTSSIQCTNAQLDGGIHPILIKSVAAAKRILGNFAPVFYTEPRQLTTRASNTTATVLQSISFSTADTYSFPGSVTETATTVADGVIFDSCALLRIQPGNTQLQAAVTLTVNKWYVATFDVKLVSGAAADLDLTITDAVSMMPDCSSLLVTGKWVSIATIGKCTTGGTTGFYAKNNGGANIFLQLSAWQIVEFANEQDALNYLNAGVFTQNDRPREIFADVAPTTGTWSAGDVCWRKTATVGQPKGWRCTVAGTPGTWVSMGNL